MHYLFKMIIFNSYVSLIRYKLIMKLNFFKYQGAGNDFIIIDKYTTNYLIDETSSFIKKLCNRKFGIGADGIIFIEKDKDVDFKMKYFNSDGNEGSLCGNAGRCAILFFKKLNNLKNNNFNFKAIDGKHNALILKNEIGINIKDILYSSIISKNNYTFLNTGSPHHVIITSNIDNIDVYNEGKKIRMGAPYFHDGVNVNFVEIQKNVLKVRTYERGVENETLSCGTGVVASAIVSFHNKQVINKNIKIITKGGILNVSFNLTKSAYKNIWLKGPAEFVFHGYIDI